VADASQSRPLISVVIASRRRETRLAFALEALAEQTLDAELFEVIVVRDGDAREPLAKAPEGIDVRFLTRPGVAGPSAKRNVGWRQARAALVAFTDDDCRAAPDWLSAILTSAGAGAETIQGRTEPDPDEALLLHGLARSQRITALSGWYETCNMAYSRSLLESLGGFDESFSFGGEDTDLGYRAVAAGARVEYADAALVWHAVMSRPVTRALREAASWREVPALVTRHRSLRKVMYLRAFWRPSHAKLPLAAAGAIIARRRPALGALLALPYLELRVGWRHERARRLVRQLTLLPIWIAIDATEIASRLPAAIRHRVFVI
jgi:GT2 family glycosyltransferase